MKLPIDEKYVVFKRELYDEFIERIIAGERNRLVLPPSIEDAVVIRTQDVFAAPGLYAYSNAIQTAIEILDEVDFVPTRVSRERLEEIRDYFHDRAVESESGKRRVPD